MACVVCQHCQGQFSKEDSIAVHGGFSYHKKCHKCYVCSETNLLNAEVFKGVIFCSSCSQRIFQGCSTARKSKNGNRSQSARAKPRAKRRERRHHERRVESAKTRHTNGVLELTRLAASTESDSSKSAKKNRSRLSNTQALSTELSLQIGKEIDNDNSANLKKESIEMGMTTEVTQELLRQMNCPVVTERKHGFVCIKGEVIKTGQLPRKENDIKRLTTTIPKEKKENVCNLLDEIYTLIPHMPGSKPQSPRPRTKSKGGSQFNQSIICSDLRIAELGASTEIAHMALRKRSEVPVIIQSKSAMNAMESSSLSGLNQVSDASGDGNDEWLESTYSLNQQDKKTWLDRRIGSILKMPYKCFKKNILNRSSLITLSMSYQESRVFIKKLKMLFNENSIEHQQRGVKRLYSTINRRKTPYKLGWLTLMAKVSAVMRPELTINDTNAPSIRCKHFNRSHSYRCMRSQVMRLAGPTKSELTAFRNKVKNIIAPKFLKEAINFSKKYPAIMMSQGCGSDLYGSSTQHIN